MKDGAHTHHDHGTGLGIPVLIGIVLALASGAASAAIGAVARVLLIAVMAVLGLVLAALICAVVAWPVIARRRRERQQSWTAAHPLPRRAPAAVPAGQRQDIAVLGWQITGLQQQLAALQATQKQATAAPARGTQHHQHLHFHGTDPAQAAALIAAKQAQR